MFNGKIGGLVGHAGWDYVNGAFYCTPGVGAGVVCWLCVAGCVADWTGGVMKATF